MREDKKRHQESEESIITDTAKMKSSKAHSGFVSHGQIIQPL